MEKKELTFEEEKELFNLWKRGRENATRKQKEEMKKRASKTFKSNRKTI